MESIDIPNSVTKIGSGAFYGCSSLESIDIPNSVTEIGYGAFSGCCALKNIIIRCKNIENVAVAQDAFVDVDFNECVLHIPSRTKWSYRHHPIFGKFKNIVAERFD